MSIMQTAVDWLFVRPQGMEKTVTYLKERYNNLPMFITENGECIKINFYINYSLINKSVFP